MRSDRAGYCRLGRNILSVSNLSLLRAKYLVQKNFLQITYLFTFNISIKISFNVMLIARKEIEHGKKKQVVTGSVEEEEINARLEAIKIQIKTIE